MTSEKCIQFYLANSSDRKKEYKEFENFLGGQGSLGQRPAMPGTLI